MLKCGIVHSCTKSWSSGGHVQVFCSFGIIERKHFGWVMHSDFEFVCECYKNLSMWSFLPCKVKHLHCLETVDVNSSESACKRVLQVLQHVTTKPTIHPTYQDWPDKDFVYTNNIVFTMHLQPLLFCGTSLWILALHINILHTLMDTPNKTLSLNIADMT